MRKLAIIISVVSIVMLYAVPVSAHGVRISHTIDATTGEITVTAEFDTGEALDDGQVVIFAPNDLINPWQVGVADENGSYTFMPDYEIEGFWDVQVRKAGHGGLVNIEITADMMPDPSAVPAETDTEDATTITLSDSTQVTISGSTDFTVDGDTVTFDTGTSAESNISTESTETPSTMMSSSSGGGITDGLTPLQQAIMIGSVIWGLIGTALFFSRGKSKP